MGITKRENMLRTLNFEHPEWIGASMGVSIGLWYWRRDEIRNLVRKYPDLFNEEHYDWEVTESTLPPACGPGLFTDNWGCVWKNIQLGIEGQVIKHPLESWDAFDSYKAPDYLTMGERGPIDWNERARINKEQKHVGEFTWGDGGRLFDRLYFLRGFENLMMDFAEDHPKLQLLIEMVWEHSMKNLKKWLDIGVDAMSFHTDIGTQQSLMISPAAFRKYLKPMFKDLFTTIRKQGTHVALSSDGNLLSIVDDLIECGVSSHDPQYRACTLKGIKDGYWGKPITINLDLDRQMFQFATPSEIDEHVKTSVQTLYHPEGGLSVSGSIYGRDVPFENIEALAIALRKYCIQMEF